MSIKRKATKATKPTAVVPYAALPVGRLTTELLVNILVLAAASDESRTLSSLTKVCQSWEAAILGSPRLNAVIKFPMLKKGIRASRKRAGKQPLTILYKGGWGSDKRTQVFLKASASLISKCETLDVSAIAGSDIDALASLPAVMLKSCRIEGPAMFGAHAHVNVVDLFCELAPRLQHLHLAHLTIPADSMISKNLLSLP